MALATVRRKYAVSQFQSLDDVLCRIVKNYWLTLVYVDLGNSPFYLF